MINMKFIHISDLHLGKRVYEYSMIEEQKNALNQIIETAGRHMIDGILIAGDIYDKPVPPVEAVSLFDEFLMKIREKGMKVFVISGNHDSAERIAFGADIFSSDKIYISKPYEGVIQSVESEDEYGRLAIHLIPFLKPAHVRKCFPDLDINDYNSALRAVVEHMDIDESKRNVVLVHQFITGAERSESEEMFLGGLDNVEFDIFEQFDYVALGHIHKPQAMGKRTVRYSGAPVKYALDEVNQKKSMTLVELKEKGDVLVEQIPFKPVHDMRRITGTYLELTDRNNYVGTGTDDYIHAVLTDESDIPDALRKLRVIYPNILKLEYDNKRTREKRSVVKQEAVRNRQPSEYIEELYRLQNNDDMSEVQAKIVKDLLEDIQ